MLTADYFKHLLIRTPLDMPTRRLKRLFDFRYRRKNPQLQHLLEEPEYTGQVLHRLLRPDSNCVDIGCHLGSVLATLVKQAPRGKHTAFEPVPQKAAWLRKKFPEVQIYELAVSDQSGSVTFYCDQNHSGFSGLRKHGGGELLPITVQRVRLSDVLKASRVDFIKLDVEGGELDALRGASELLARDHPPVLFECVIDALNQFGATPRLIHELFQSLGYRVFLMQDFLSGGAPLTCRAFEAAHEFPFKAINYLAVHG